MFSILFHSVCFAAGCFYTDPAQASYSAVLSQTANIATLTITNRFTYATTNDQQISFESIGPVTLEPNPRAISFSQRIWLDKGTPTNQYISYLRFRLNGPVLPAWYTTQPMSPLPAPPIPPEIITFRFRTDTTGALPVAPLGITAVIEEEQ